MIPVHAERRAILAEDDAVTAMAVSGWLRDLGWAVVAVDSAEAALATALILRPQLAVCDVALTTERDGVWLASELRYHVPEATVVLTTANPTLPGQVTLRSHVAAYLTKSFDRHAFARVIQGIDASLAVSGGSSLEWPTEARQAIDESRRALVAAITELVQSGPCDDMTTAAVLVAGESIDRASRGADLAEGVGRRLGLPAALQRYLRQAVLLEPLGRQIFPDAVAGLQPHERSMLVARDAQAFTSAALSLLGMPEAAELLSLAAAKGHPNAAVIGRLPVSALVVDALRAVCLWRRLVDPIDATASADAARRAAEHCWVHPDLRIPVPVRQAVERVWLELRQFAGEPAMAS